VFHFLRSPQGQAGVMSDFHGATVGGISRGFATKTVVPSPEVGEQSRIAAILDQADALRAKRRAALAQLDNLTQSIFIEMFGDPVTNPKGWPRVRFASLLENIDSGWSPVCMDRAAQGDEWGVLKLGAVTSCAYKDWENKALPDGVAFDSKIEVRPGDLLFSRKNTYNLVAAFVLVNATRERLMLSDLIFRFRLNSDAKVEKRYLQSLLVFPTKRSEVQKLAGGSSGSMPNISKGRLLELDIELPPLSLQQIYSTRIQSIEALKATNRTALAELDTLFASLQHRAFRGDL
jgi:type I restriction enzyme S subunit